MMGSRRRREPAGHDPGSAGRRPADPRKPEPTTFNLVFVCTGNTCRSPMAEALARDELDRRGWRHVRVASAGVAASPGAPASAEAVEAARRHGLDLAAHRSQPLTPELVEWADLVLAMGPAHLASVLRAGGEEKAAMLGEFAGSGSRGVIDPFGGDAAVYERTLLELRSLVGAALDRLAPILQP